MQARSLGDLALEPMPPLEVHDRYLDTEDGLLLREGVFLRFREHGGVVTVSLRAAEGESGEEIAHARYRGSLRLESGRLALPDGGLREALQARIGSNPLSLILHFKQIRTPRALYDGSRLAAVVSLDVVVDQTGPSAELVSNEVEVEVVPGGTPADLAHVDAQLRALGFHADPFSKFERGILRRGAEGGSLYLLPREREALESLAASLSAIERRRAQVILFASEGFETREISQKVSLSPSRVRHWCHAFRHERMRVFDESAPEPALDELEEPLQPFEVKEAVSHDDFPPRSEDMASGPSAGGPTVPDVDAREVSRSEAVPMEEKADAVQSESEDADDFLPVEEALSQVMGTVRQSMQDARDEAEHDESIEELPTDPPILSATESSAHEEGPRAGSFLIDEWFDAEADEQEELAAEEELRAETGRPATAAPSPGEAEEIEPGRRAEAERHRNMGAAGEPAHSESSPAELEWVATTKSPDATDPLYQASESQSAAQAGADPLGYVGDSASQVEGRAGEAETGFETAIPEEADDTSSEAIPEDSTAEARRHSNGDVHAQTSVTSAGTEPAPGRGDHTATMTLASGSALISDAAADILDALADTLDGAADNLTPDATPHMVATIRATLARLYGALAVFEDDLPTSEGMVAIIVATAERFDHVIALDSAQQALDSVASERKGEIAVALARTLWAVERRRMLATLVGERPLSGLVSQLRAVVERLRRSGAEAGPGRPRQVRHILASQLWRRYEAVRALEKPAAEAAVDLAALRTPLDGLRHALVLSPAAPAVVVADSVERVRQTLHEYLAARELADRLRRVVEEWIRPGEAADPSLLEELRREADHRAESAAKAFLPLWETLLGSQFREALGRVTASV
jgi:inorganic triphosphatase YgiF